MINLEGVWKLLRYKVSVVNLNMLKSMKHKEDRENCYRVNMIDFVVEDTFQDQIP